MRLTPLALAALAGAALAYALRPAPSVPGVPERFTDEVARTDSLRLVAEAERDSARTALADSTEAWRAERRRLAVVTAEARRDAYRIAEDLRATLDTAGVRMLDELQATHAVEVEALEAEIATHEAEVAGLRAGLRTAELVIRAQRDEIHAWGALDAERQAIDRAKDSAIATLNRKSTVNRALAAGGMGKMCYDAISEGQNGIAIGSCGAALYAAVGG